MDPPVWNESLSSSVYGRAGGGQVPDREIPAIAVRKH